MGPTKSTSRERSRSHLKLDSSDISQPHFRGEKSLPSGNPLTDRKETSLPFSTSEKTLSSPSRVINPDRRDTGPSRRDSSLPYSPQEKSYFRKVPTDEPLSAA